MNNDILYSAIMHCLMIFGAVAGLCGIGGWLVLVLAWLNDRWQRRDRK